MSSVQEVLGKCGEGLSIIGVALKDGIVSGVKWLGRRVVYITKAILNGIVTGVKGLVTLAKKLYYLLKPFVLETALPFLKNNRYYIAAFVAGAVCYHLFLMLRERREDHAVRGGKAVQESNDEEAQ